MAEEPGSMTRLTATADLAAAIGYSMFDTSYEGSYMLGPEDGPDMGDDEKARRVEKDATELKVAVNSIDWWHFPEGTGWARDIIIKLVSGNLLYEGLPSKGEDTS